MQSPPTSVLTIRPATLDDVPALTALIERSAHGLAQADYSQTQIAAALGSAWGVDSQLIADRTYFVVESSGGTIVACGGWSYRTTLFGGDAIPDRTPERLDPATEAARIRAFFVDPSFARRGLGRMLLSRCEQEAIHQGFRRAELLATIAGHRLYRANGYTGDEHRRFLLPGNVGIDFIPMSKALTADKGGEGVA